jgi:hypothetical protein
MEGSPNDSIKLEPGRLQVMSPMGLTHNLDTYALVFVDVVTLEVTFELMD